PIYYSHQVRPVIREQSRLNSARIEAYATAKGREQLVNVDKAAKKEGFKHGVQTVLSYGGLANMNYSRLHETMISGTVGGIYVSKHVCVLIGKDSMFVNDMV